MIDLSIAKSKIYSVVCIVFSCLFFLIGCGGGDSLNINSDNNEETTNSFQYTIDPAQETYINIDDPYTGRNWDFTFPIGSLSSEVTVTFTFLDGPSQDCSACNLGFFKIESDGEFIILSDIPIIVTLSDDELNDPNRFYQLNMNNGESLYHTTLSICTQEDAGAVDAKLIPEWMTMWDLPDSTGYFGFSGFCGGF